MEDFTQKKVNIPTAEEINEAVAGSGKAGEARPAITRHLRPGVFFLIILATLLIIGLFLYSSRNRPLSNDGIADMVASKLSSGGSDADDGAIVEQVSLELTAQGESSADDELTAEEVARKLSQ